MTTLRSGNVFNTPITRVQMKPKGFPTTLGQEARTERPMNKWITSNTIPIKNKIQEIWTATAATPAKFRAPAMTPTTKNISA